MKRIKRQQTDTIFDNNNNNKKSKLENETIIINTTTTSHFEDLANEILYEIFEYLDIYHIYEGFFNLNKRFKNLLFNSKLPIQINISTMSKSNFEYYHKNLILPNKHRINYLRLSNPFTVDIIFSPPRIISKFLQLETLVLDNIHAKYLNNILDHLKFLPQLYSLTINSIDYIQNSTLFYIRIFRLPKLKYCKIKFESKDDVQPLSISANEFSPIEYLIINNHFRFQSFNNLLSYLPQLRHLSINCLDGLDFNNIEFYPIKLKHFKYVSLQFDCVYFNRLEKLIKNFFYYIEILHLTTKYDSQYLDALRWEELILSYMPNLRIFDINHDGSAQFNSLMYHHLINEFNSSFWMERKWFFTHRHDWEERLDTGIFYSTDPYRRKDYTFCWNLDQQTCSHIQEDFNSVKHVFIHTTRATNNSRNYFPNAIELTINEYFQTSDESISTSLNSIIPLEQLTKLTVIDSFDFPFEELLNLLYFTPNLHTLKYDHISFNETNSELIQKSDIFQSVSNTNKIKNLDLGESCILEEMEMIVNLFPELEYLKTGIIRREFEQIIRFLLSKNNNQTRHLSFLCILELPKICLRKLNMLIKSENLLDNYCIKFVNRGLYLWW